MVLIYLFQMLKPNTTEEHLLKEKYKGNLSKICRNIKSLFCTAVDPDSLNTDPDPYPGF
jgi:hypothetical protein